MSTLTAEIGSTVNTSQRYEHFYHRNRVKCNQHFKISPCFRDEEEAATKEAGGLGRRKHIRRGRRRTLGEDEAASTTGPRPGKQTPATSSTARLEEDDDDVTPSVLRPKQITKSCHEHHVYVIMHVMECVDTIFVT